MSRVACLIHIPLLFCLTVFGCGEGEQSTDFGSGSDGTPSGSNTVPPMPDDQLLDVSPAMTMSDAGPGLDDQPIRDADIDPGPETTPTDGWTTEAVFQALQPMCVACHGEGQSSPFFVNLEGFINGIVNDEQYIVFGDSENSAFLNLLEGTFEGTFAQMPPGGATYAELVTGDTSKPTIADLAQWIDRLTTAPESFPDEICLETPSTKLIHRLNRLEYNRSVAKLLGTSQTPADDFPSEDLNFGFDNIAQALTVSPLLIEKYDLAAQSLAAEAIPPATISPEEFAFEAESQMEATVGGPSGDGNSWIVWSNGTITATPSITTPGQYRIRASLRGGQAGPDSILARFIVNDAEVHRFNVTTNTFEVFELGNVSLEDGANSVSVGFLNDYWCPQNKFDLGECGGGDPGMIGDRNLYVDWLSVEGPLDANYEQSEFESRFLSDCDLAAQQAAYPCARDAMNRFARFAWRRPLSDSESDRLWALASQEFEEENGLRNGLRQTIHAILLSPHFLFRVESGVADGGPLSAHERATRLAMFLWRSTPSEALLDQADEGVLDTEDGVAAVAASMMADATPLIEDFAEQWLLLKQAALVDPEYALFPDFDEALRESMLQETRLVFAELWAEDRPLLDIVNAEFTYVNERLATHYGIEGIEGDLFQRIELPLAHRKGVLTHASWLAATSQRTRTSPVKRGKWVLEELLCEAPPPPPPSVEGLPEDVDQMASLRERLEQHRADPACAACHTHMDAVGFGLEQFDAVGAFRTHDVGEEIDPAGELLGGTPFANAIEMADALRAHPNLGPCMTDKMLIYALGRGLNDGEHCFVEAIDAAASAADYRTAGLVEAIVRSPMFLNRGMPNAYENGSSGEDEESNP